MNWARGLALLMTAECFVASGAYLYQGDWKRAVYWIFIAGANTTLAYI